jgi:hypothetical protein
MNAICSDFLAAYRPHNDLPALASLATFEHASRPGLSVEESVHRLKLHHYALKRLHQIFIARLTSEPVYELKMAFSYHAHLCAENVSALRDRVGEMREPPLGLDKIPHPVLEVFFDEILCAPSTRELVAGIYEVTVPALECALEKHVEDAHPLADQPSRRVCRQALADIKEIAAYGSQAAHCLVENQPASPAFVVRLQSLLALAGGLDGTSEPAPGEPERVFSKNGFRFNPVPKRDGRFPDPFNMGVNAEALLYDETMPADAKVLMMFYKRLREIDVPEMMASILTETQDKPWAYYRDLTRQLWDEARHAMMGEVGFVSLGVDWPSKVLVNHTWALCLNTQLTAQERHAVLYFIEQGLMPKTGKRHEWEVAVMAKNPLAATFQDFDWADEVLHARVGRDWYVSGMPSSAEAVDYGDKCWSKVALQWKAFRDQSLTQHQNWWPALYRGYCENFGLDPDPAALAFHETYESTRADLKGISASA